MPKHVIIGGGIAGFSALDTLLERGETDVALVSDEKYPLYNRVDLKKFPKTSMEVQELFMKKPVDYPDEVKILLNTEVQEIDPGGKKLKTGRGEFDYEKLALAVGGRPREIPAENSGLEGIHYLWTLEQARHLKEEVEEVENPAVIGGGLLGIDLASIFARTGSEPTYLIREDAWWEHGLCEPGSRLVEEAMEKEGVNVVHGEEVQSFLGEDGRIVGVETGKGNRYSCDIAGVAVGLVPNTELAEDAGIETGRGIITDERLETSEDGVYAAGDVAEYRDVVLGERRMDGSWDGSKAQGDTVGANMAGEEKVYRNVSVYTVDHFGLSVMSVGDAERKEDREVFFHRDGREYVQVNMKGGQVVGGVLVGRADLLADLKNAVEAGENLEELGLDVDLEEGSST